MRSHETNQKKQHKKAEQIVSGLELPRDLFLGMPVLSMEGNRLLCIENHRGIVRYTSEMIVVAARYYSIQISGRQLLIPRFTKDFVEITGYMENISFLI